jgi:hypothetical protein
MAEQSDFDKLLERAKAKEARAEYLIGMKYYKGDEVEKDELLGITYILKAAEQNFDPALFEKEKIEDKAKPNEEKGYKGDPNLQYILGRIYYQNHISKIDKWEGVDWLKLAEKNGHKDAIAFIKKHKLMIWFINRTGVEEIKAYFKLPLALFAFILMVIVNVIIKNAGTLMTAINTGLINIIMDNIIDPIMAFITGKSLIGRALRAASKIVFLVFSLVVFIVFEVQSCSGREVDNRLYHFLSEPDEYILSGLSLDSMTEPQDSGAVSNKFFSKRDSEAYKNYTTTLSVLPLFLTLVISYALSHIFFIRILFHNSNIGKLIVLGFLFIGLYFLFLSQLNFYVVAILLGIGFSCANPTELQKGEVGSDG